MGVKEKMIGLVDFDSFYEAVKVTAEIDEKRIKKEFVRQYLDEWATAKEWLFEKFGEKLILNETVDIAVTDSVMTDLLRGIYSKYPQYTATIAEISVSEFRKNEISAKDTFISWMFPKICKKGAKPSRVLSQILQDAQFDIDLSKIMQNRTVKGNVSVSIHPMDFITMSTKSNNSTSCMDVVRGFHKTGGFSLMRDSQSVIAYHDHGSVETFGNQYGSFKWNNKVFRQLLLVEKDSIAFGHEYPSGIVDSDTRKMWAKMISSSVLGKEVPYRRFDGYANKKGQFYYDACLEYIIGNPEKGFDLGVKDLICIECGKRFTDIRDYHDYLSCK